MFKLSKIISDKSVNTSRVNTQLCRNGKNWGTFTHKSDLHFTSKQSLTSQFRISSQHPRQHWYFQAVKRSEDAHRSWFVRKFPKSATQWQWMKIIAKELVKTSSLFFGAFNTVLVDKISSIKRWFHAGYYEKPAWKPFCIYRPLNIPACPRDTRANIKLTREGTGKAPKVTP